MDDTISRFNCLFAIPRDDRRLIHVEFPHRLLECRYFPLARLWLHEGFADLNKLPFLAIPLPDKIDLSPTGGSIIVDAMGDRPQMGKQEIFEKMSCIDQYPARNGPDHGVIRTIDFSRVGVLHGLGGVEYFNRKQARGCVSRCNFSVRHTCV